MLSLVFSLGRIRNLNLEDSKEKVYGQINPSFDIERKSEFSFISEKNKVKIS